MIEELSKNTNPDQRLLRHIIKCYTRLAENKKYCMFYISEPEKVWSSVYLKYFKTLITISSKMKWLRDGMKSYWLTSIWYWRRTIISTTDMYSLSLSDYINVSTYILQSILYFHFESLFYISIDWVHFLSYLKYFSMNCIQSIIELLSIHPNLIYHLHLSLSFPDLSFSICLVHLFLFNLLLQSFYFLFDLLNLL